LPAGGSARFISLVSVLIVSTALRAGSKTSVIAHSLRAAFEPLQTPASVLDLATTPLPMCDGGACYQDRGAIAATEKLRAASAVILCFPVYNHQANAAAKNFVEVTNDGWSGKVVGLVANGGTDRSYLAPLSLASSLMVDHRCIVVPRFVFVTPQNFASDGTLPVGGEIVGRFTELARDVVHLAPHWPVPEKLG
jgi:NAD(P)H-dependent FMN reductase